MSSKYQPKSRFSDSLFVYILLLFFILLFLKSTPAFSEQGNDLNLIEIQDPWVRAPAPFAHALGGFMLLKNHSDDSVILVQVKADGFDEVMLHQSINENGMHRMEHAENIIIPPQGHVKFQHGSYHIMFMGLQKKIISGDVIPVTLVFDSGQEKLVSFIVRKPD